MPPAAIPQVNLDIQDGALGIIPAATDQIHVKIGVASKGTQNQILSFTSTKQVRDTLGSGPLAEALAVALALSGGPIYAIRGVPSTAGAAGAVTPTRVGTSDGTLAVTGTPHDRYDAVVEITRSGSVANGEAAFKYTLDGGDTWSAEIALADYTIADTGITLDFNDGVATPTFEKGDTFAFTTTAPAMSLTDLNTSIDALLADSREWGFLHVVGAATPSIAAGVATRMQEAEAAYRYAFAILEARDIDAAETEDTWMSALITEWANFADKRVAVVAGHAELTSSLTGRIHRRNVAWPYTGRLSSISISEDPARYARGPIPGVVSLHHDEQAKPGLNSEGFTTFRTIIGVSGFYVTNGLQRAPEGSDYDLVQNLRVINRACKITRVAALRFLSENVRVDPVTGFILEAEAQKIEAHIRGQLQTGLLAPGNASDVQVTVGRDNAILSDRTLYLSVRVTPLGYAKTIEVDIGFRNPALEPAQPEPEPESEAS